MKYAFIYPGQGSQSIGMGLGFYDNFDIAKKLIQEASDTLHLDFKDLLFKENDQINLTKFTQPSIFLVSFIAYSILKENCDIAPSISFGHSLGEVSAVSCSGGIDFNKALQLTSMRGQYMEEACQGKDAGMMVVLGLSDQILEEFCAKKQSEGKSIWCANYNVDAQMVLAGKKADLDLLQGALKELGAKRTLLLNMSVASHCPLLEDAIPRFKATLGENINDTFGDVLSNATMEIYSTKQQAIELLSAQLINPVKYKQSVAKIDSNIDVYIELGNGSVLKGLNRKLSQKPTLNISDPASLKDTLSEIEKLKENK